MKQTKHCTLRILLPILFAFFSLKTTAQAVPIKQTLYGQNAWFIDATNGTGLEGYYSKMKDMGVKYCRIGGIDANFRPLYSWNPVTYTVSSNSEIVNLAYVIDSLRYYGIEPIIEVGYNPICTNTVSSALATLSRADQAVVAGRVVKYLNTVKYSTNPIKYWIIANEPDLSQGTCNTNPNDEGGFGYAGTNYADTIAAYIKSFATEMKNADSTIKIIGPELAMFGNDQGWSINQMMDKLITNPSNAYSVMGKVPGKNKYYIDILSYHQYPTPTNRADLIGQPTYSLNGFQANITTTASGRSGVIDLLSGNSGTGRNISNLKLSVTELNVDVKTYDYESTEYNKIIVGYDNRSFLGGQWLADVYSQAMETATTNTATSQNESWMEFLTPWSMIEGNDSIGLGFLSGAPSIKGQPRPSYYHYKLLSDNFIGRYYRGTSANSSLKAFASAQTPYGFKILVLNQDTVNDYHCHFNTIGNTTSTVSPYNARFDFDFTGDPSVGISTNSVILTPTINPIKKASTVLLVFDCYGNLVYRKDYTMTDAKQNKEPHLRQIGNEPVDASLIYCGLPGAIGGTLTTNTAYSNATVSVSSDLILNTGVSLTFDNCLVIMAPGTKIKGSSRNAITINKTVMVGCEGNTWVGIEHSGNYLPGESLTVDSSAIVNADMPIRTLKLASINITASSLVQGTRAIELRQPKTFTIKNTLLAGFRTAIYTKNAVASNQSYIQENYTMECDTAIKAVSSGHDSLYITCNRFEFKNYGISATSTTLKNFGTSSVGAGNRFIKTTSLSQTDFLELSGSTPTYYYDPKYSAEWANAVSNLTQTQASNDGTCPSVLTETCGVWPEIGINEQSLTASAISVYPNPSSGTFNLAFKEGKGVYTLNVYDVIGRMVLSRKVDFTNEKVITFDLKSSGMYIISLTNGKEALNKKVIVE